MVRGAPGMALRGQHRPRGKPRVTARQRAQGVPRPDFQQHAVRLGEQGIQPLGKAHGMAQMAPPIRRAARLLVGDPVAAEVGYQGNLRPGPFNARQQRLEFVEHGLDQRRMKRMRHVQALRGRALTGELAFGVIDGLGGTGDHAKIGRIDGRDGARRGQCRL